MEAKNVIIETDSKICHNAIHELILPPPWRIASILADMQSLLVTYSNVSIFWVPRLANMAAHSLAKWSLACNFFGSFDWVAVLPVLLLLLGRKLAFNCILFLFSIKYFFIKKKK